MGLPKDIGVIDTMLGIPTREDRSDWYANFRPLLRDAESLQAFEMPAQYMFRGVPDIGAVDDYVAWTVGQMDKYNIDKAMVGLDDRWSQTALEAKERFPDRFFFDVPADPNGGMEEVRRIKRLHREYGIKAVSVFPCGTFPQVAIDHKYMFPLYATCVELDIPMVINAGVPGPRVPMSPQKVERLDEVCWFFPDLRIVMRHGAEPWDDLAVKLMLKWPNLYYSTSAFAPRHLPKSIINFANTRGADKVIYAGYFPMGLSLERIFKELNDLPLKDEVWPKFLRDNARRVFKLD
ncbi:MAG: amidohydrolase family protein [Novosphingobium sp.]|nr:amidohydrolase family protein [Novosphingobium sp.]